MKIVLFLLKWSVAWGLLFDGIVGILSLGFYYPGLALKSAKTLAYTRMMYRKDN